MVIWDNTFHIRNGCIELLVFYIIKQIFSSDLNRQALSPELFSIIIKLNLYFIGFVMKGFRYILKILLMGEYENQFGKLWYYYNI